MKEETKQKEEQESRSGADISVLEEVGTSTGALSASTTVLLRFVAHRRMADAAASPS